MRPEFDVLVAGGRIIDGTGRPAFPADVGIREGRIAAVGDLGGTASGARIDAGGRIVAPGFIDLHSHHDLVFALPPEVQARYLEGRLRQGITTEIVGNCGFGAFPVDPADGPAVRALLAFIAPPEPVPLFRRAGDYLDHLERQGVLANVGALAPHGPMRIGTVGSGKRRSTEVERNSMAERMRESLDAGCFGISFGLIYPPGRFSETDELVRVSEPLAGRGAFAAFHQRSGSAEILLRAIEEITDVGRRSGAAVHLSHDHAHGPRAWPLLEESLAIRDRARTSGVDVTADVIPYTGVNTTLLALLPDAALEGGVPALLRRLADPAERRRIRREMEETIPSWPPWEEGRWCTNLLRDAGPDLISIAGARGTAARAAGRTLLHLARERGTDPIEAAFDLLLEAGGEATMLIFGISGDRRFDEPLRRLLAEPDHIVVSDAWEAGQAHPHPGAAGAFPHFLRLAALDSPLLGLEAAIRKITSLPAARLGLSDRGCVATGAAADLVLFDPGAIAAPSTWEEPRRFAAGISHVLVNGDAVVSGGRYSAVAAGRVLRRSG